MATKTQKKASSPTKKSTAKTKVLKKSLVSKTGTKTTKANMTV
jgi:hypothetical protein